MKFRFVRGVALVATLAVAVTAGPAFARSSTVPVTFKEGKPITFGVGPGATRFDGQFYEGSFEASDVTGITYDELLAGFRAGTVYGNVHTTAFPGGEMRGQVQNLR